MLNEMIATIECSLRFRFVPAFLVLMPSHVRIVRMSQTTKWTRLDQRALGVATEPRRTKGVHGVFMANPFVLGLESSRTESTEEREVFLRFTGTVDTVDALAGIW